MSHLEVLNSVPGENNPAVDSAVQIMTKLFKQEGFLFRLGYDPSQPDEPFSPNPAELLAPALRIVDFRRLKYPNGNHGLVSKEGTYHMVQIAESGVVEVSFEPPYNAVKEGITPGGTKTIESVQNPLRSVEVFGLGSSRFTTGFISGRLISRDNFNQLTDDQKVRALRGWTDIGGEAQPLKSIEMPQSSLLVLTIQRYGKYEDIQEWQQMPDMADTKGHLWVPIFRQASPVKKITA